MTQITTPFSLDQIGYTPVRFNSTGIFESHKDHMVDPYAATRMPKVPQVEGIQFAPQGITDILPAMVVLHDRWGLTSPIQELAKQLACFGYVVLVPNLYGRQGGMVTANDEVADALQERLDVSKVLTDIHASFEYLNANLTEDKLLERTARNAHAVVGFGMGGTLAIQTATHRRRLQAAVAIGGSVPNDSEVASQLHCPLQFQLPGTHPQASSGELNQFVETAEGAGKTVKTHVVPDTDVEFWYSLSPHYNATKTEQALQQAMEFINPILKKT